ncbi:methylenetetrahydrofolate reductase [Paracoccus spongiarum]|uniref:Methylenetetrahydrofolate reductase n=1 Tax=Paracoccus spongiarum TaxID=3064387 RepID=A0ABT9JD65_9RHOB|nr:methylenetetrahydrofolate reductase [Paracoccus sp. 2205BS29-5]MDP5307776.1 methylenetetrahydrofolate reductase [Paracoccus sp. 2205BS29-5]
MALMQFRSPPHHTAAMAAFLDGASIEVMPRTAAGITDFRDHLPAGTMVFVAHIDGTPAEAMQATVARLAHEGFRPVPHIPARMVADRAMLAEWVAAYRDGGAEGALLLGGGLSSPRGAFSDSMQLLDSGLFGEFRRLFVAGHPEGSRDIDPGGGEAEVMRALRWKADFAARTDARMQIVTQFAFEAQPVIAWARRLRAAGIDMPIRIGVAGPAKLQTMLKFAIMCGVGPSLRVLQRRARDVTKLLVPYQPTDFVAELAEARADDPDFPISAAHLFPLGGIAAATGWLSAARAR